MYLKCCKFLSTQSISNKLSCSGGVSSLKLLWHGCGGIFSFQSNVPEEPLVYDGTTTVTEPQSKIKFTPCECYEKIITLKGEAINCEVNDTIVLEEDREMCIVSVTSDNIVNLRQPLPNPLIIVQNDFVDDAESNFPLTTFFDTSCVANQGKDVLPTYPGYGKFPNTVQDEGLIIIEYSSKERLQLSRALKYFQGLPSTDLFWFEFIDGTSKSFWPKKTQQAASFFDPSFASCSCLKCDSSPPSLKPSTLPYSPSPSKSPSGFEPPDPVKGCAGKYQICDKYSKENCKTTTSGPTWNIGQKCDFSLVVNATTALNYEKSNVQSLNQEESNRRKLHALKGLVDSIESGNISVSGASLFGNLLTQDFLENQITFHLKTKNLLNAQLVTIKGH